LQFPVPSYSFYPVYCDLLGIAPDKIPLNTDFTLALDQFGSGGDQSGGNCGGIIFPNPNAPTGIAVGCSQIEELLQSNPDVVVLIDEAYADFGAQSAIGLINKYPNLVVSRTYSKGRSLAGLRLGAAFANSELIDGLVRTKDSFNSYPVDAIAQAAGVASINDEPYYRETIDKICATRERSVSALVDRGYRVFESLNKNNILIRYWDKPVLSDWLRITIGTDEQMDRFFKALTHT